MTAAHPQLDTQKMPMRTRALAICALLLIAALYFVGVNSHGVLRHIVQTAPVWVAVVLGMQRSAWSKWVALPCFVVWLLLMSLIWLFLLGWAHLISGTFPPIEIAMTLVVGASAIIGIFLALRLHTGLPASRASVAFLGMLVLQIVALRISFLPGIAHD
jgi:hypothetical protein